MAYSCETSFIEPQAISYNFDITNSGLLIVLIFINVEINNSWHLDSTKNKK